MRLGGGVAVTLRLIVQIGSTSDRLPVLQQDLGQIASGDLPITIQITPGGINGSPKGEQSSDVRAVDEAAQVQITSLAFTFVQPAISIDVTGASDLARVG